MLCWATFDTLVMGRGERAGVKKMANGRDIHTKKIKKPKKGAKRVARVEPLVLPAEVVRKRRKESVPG